jgi:uncharacterized protein YifN (PemK superfamily)
MVKRRPAIVISPQIQGRVGLCTVVPLSTEAPKIRLPFHIELPKLILPPPFEKGPNWVKADMVFAAAFSRLELFRDGRDQQGRREYMSVCISDVDLIQVRAAILCGLGLSSLTKHLT